MRFLSLFSGIEGASVAWPDWECAAVAEIEPFPCAVLKHHYPEIRNLGDVTKITQQQIEELGHIDVVIGGFPCQDVSVAGKRKGLKNADGTHTRSGLFYHAADIANWSKARWVIVENVPGLFSSHEGRDFASVVGELAGCNLDVPGDGWLSSGVALGEKGLVEWFVLDAQWRGLAQRRKRVFVVRDTGDWTHRPPFFPLTESLLRNPPPRRETGQGTTHSLAPCLGASGRGFDRTGDTRGQDAVIPIQEIGTFQKTGQGWWNGESVAQTLRDSSAGGASHANVIAHSLRADGFDASEDGTGRGTPLVPEVTGTLTNNYGISHGRSAGNNGGIAQGQLIPEVSAPVRAAPPSKHAGGSYFTEGHLIPEVSPPLRAGGNETGGDRPHGTDVDTCESLIPEVALQERDSKGSDSSTKDGHPPAVAFQPRIARNGRGDMGDKVNALQAQSGQTGKGDAAPCVATGYAVRRLTPICCERLQGFPDGYTAIPWHGKPPEQCPDGPRYKALGNSFAVPVVAWLGRRILELHV